MADATAPGGDPRLLPALVGTRESLDRLTPVLARLRARRIAPDVALLAPRRLPALRRAARRYLPSIRNEGSAWVIEQPTSPATWAAARFVVRLADVLGWPPGATAPLLTGEAEPDDPEDREVAYRLLRLWTALLDERLDPLAGEHLTTAVPSTAGWTVPTPSAIRRTRRTLRRALAEGRCVLITYAGRTRKLTTHRIVEPRALERSGGRAYLRAFCRWRQGERLFRLDRIEKLELLDERFRLDDAG